MIQINVGTTEVISVNLTANDNTCSVTIKLVKVSDGSIVDTKSVNAMSVV